MPAYKTHDMIAYVTTIPITIIASTTLSLSPYDVMLFSGVYLGASYYLSPDLDIHSIMVKRWGKFAWLWYPYRRLIKHRSIYSHSGPISAAIRLAYISLPFILVGLLVNIPIIFTALHSHVFLLVYLAMAISDLVHTLSDIIWSVYKRTCIGL